MSVPMKPGDPAYWMLLDDFVTIPKIYRPNCYICEDPEFAQMGLPLCKPCKACGGHVPADDDQCDDCEHVCHPGCGHYDEDGKPLNPTYHKCKNEQCNYWLSDDSFANFCCRTCANTNGVNHAQLCAKMDEQGTPHFDPEVARERYS